MKFPISTDTRAIHFPPIIEVKGWLEGQNFPADKPLVDLCQAIPDYVPPMEILDQALEASGSFFVWVRHPWPKLSGRETVRRLPDEANLICLPGEVFGPGLENYLRLTFGNIREDEIVSAVERFRALSGSPLT
ncbi:MAG TPA: hypothetical protein VJ974_09130 [Geopsychrobacteraceae bacterium]|nr:hypothetical protein [Geopsychrobacteraceae bacterium]